MKHLVEIDDATETGKNVFELLKTLSKTDISIDVIADNEEDLVDTISFNAFADNLLSTLEKKLNKK